jgi:hypothetical protein
MEEGKRNVFFNGVVSELPALPPSAFSSYSSSSSSFSGSAHISRNTTLDRKQQREWRSTSRAHVAWVVFGGIQLLFLQGLSPVQRSRTKMEMRSIELPCLLHKARPFFNQCPCLSLARRTEHPRWWRRPLKASNYLQALRFQCSKSTCPTKLNKRRGTGWFEGKGWVSCMENKEIQARPHISHRTGWVERVFRQLFHDLNCRAATRTQYTTCYMTNMTLERFR